jgi:hypothetical protein
MLKENFLSHSNLMKEKAELDGKNLARGNFSTFPVSIVRHDW